MSSASLTLVLRPLVMRTVSASVSVISGCGLSWYSLSLTTTLSLGMLQLAVQMLDDLHGEGNLLLLPVLGGVVFPHVTGLIPG